MIYNSLLLLLFSVMLRVGVVICNIVVLIVIGI